MADQRTQSCTLCMSIPLFIGLLGLWGMYLWTKESKAEFIQNDLGIKSETLLSEQQVGGVVVNMDGRNAVLTGSVDSEQRSQEIEAIIASLDGIRTVDNQLEIVRAEISEPKLVEIETPEPDIILDPEPEVEVAIAPEPEELVPAEEVVEEILQTLDLSGITFLFGSEEITEQGTVILDEVVTILNEHPEFAVVVEGHTDNVGDENINLDLSQRRAISVMNYLINQGIQAERLSAVGYGETNPITSNDTPEGRAENRRIDFEVARRE